MNGVDPATWAVLLLILGCGLACLEIFIPSGGLISFLSALALLGCIVMAFRRNPETGFTFLCLAVVGVPIVVGLALKFWPQTPMGKSFLGELAQDGELVPEDWRRQLVGHHGVATSEMLPSGAVRIDGHPLDAVSHSGAIAKGQTVVIVEVRGNRVIVRPTEDLREMDSRKLPGDLVPEDLVPENRVPEDRAPKDRAPEDGLVPGYAIDPGPPEDLLSKPIEELGLDLESLDDPLA
jgi:membrane-bound ClpP family serine protease